MSGRLAALLHHNFGLVVSLIRNEVEFALAAERAGADAVKIHLNVEHRASGLKFGSFAEEEERILSIVEAVEIPVGLMPGTADKFIDHSELEALDRIGIDFIDYYHRDAPDWLDAANICPDLMPAISEHDGPELADHIDREGYPLVELSVLPHVKYGTPLDEADLKVYRDLARRITAPCIVPTQKKILPGQVDEIKGAGISALMVGAVVTGTRPLETEKAIAEFRRAIDHVR